MANTRLPYLWTKAVSAKIGMVTPYLHRSLVGSYGDIEGSTIAIPGIAEKGYVDTIVKVSTPGGHSSVPPPHTVSDHLSSINPI
jgi:hypothetical protein